MTENGWIKIHRDIWKNPWMFRPNVLTDWVYILCHVEFQPTDIVFEGKRITLQPGQGLFKFSKVASELKIPVTTVHRITELLKNEKQIEKKTSPRNTVITVVNWDKYQTSEKQNENQVENKWKTNGKQMENLHISNKNLRNKELKNSTPTEEEPQQSEYKVFTEKWNALPLHNIVSLKGKRLDMLRARVKEYGMDDVLKAIDIIQRSPFLLGQNNSNWQITIDWFLKPNNFPKVLEGNYLPKTEEIPKEDNLEKVLNQPKKEEPEFLFMDIVRAYKEAKEHGETRTLQDFAEEYRQRKRGEMNGISSTA